jgi:hypothetical protein
MLLYSWLREVAWIPLGVVWALVVFLFFGDYGSLYVIVLGWGVLYLISSIFFGKKLKKNERENKE